MWLLCGKEAITRLRHRNKNKANEYKFQICNLVFVHQYFPHSLWNKEGMDFISEIYDIIGGWRAKIRGQNDTKIFKYRYWKNSGDIVRNSKIWNSQWFGGDI